MKDDANWCAKMKRTVRARTGCIYVCWGGEGGWGICRYVRYSYLRVFRGGEGSGRRNMPLSGCNPVPLGWWLRETR